MGVLDKAKEHFKAFPVQQIEVPEWDITIYWKPLTLQERSDLFGQGSLTLGDYATVLLKKALKEDGSKLFTLEDKLPLLNQVEPTVVQRIALAILAVPKPADVEKN